MSINSRIKERRESLNMSRIELAEKIGVTASAIANYENEISSPKIEVMYKIFNALKCDANYLYQDEMGINYPMKVTYDEIEHIKKYRSLDLHGKKMVDFTLQEEYERIAATKENKVPQQEVPTRIISYYYKSASAGTGQIVFDSPPDKDIEIPDIPEYRNVSYSIGVNGDSMTPKYHDGDILLVEATENVRRGEIGIFYMDGECYVKKLGTNELISLNPQYDSIHINESFRCMGRVIGKL